MDDDDQKLDEREAGIAFLQRAIARIREHLRNETAPLRRRELRTRLTGLEEELQELEAGPGAKDREPWTLKIQKLQRNA